jgi:hypothetical protein
MFWKDFINWVDNLNTHSFIKVQKKKGILEPKDLFFKDGGNTLSLSFGSKWMQLGRDN